VRSISEAATQVSNVNTWESDRMRDGLFVRRQAGSGVAELWCGPSLLGLLHDEHDGLVIRLEAHARALTVSVGALERALAEAREGRTPAQGAVHAV
jgi:hypothetical protein